MTTTFIQEFALAVQEAGEQIDALATALPCAACGGKGERTIESAPYPLTGLIEREECPYCKGTGLAVCSVCHRPITDPGSAWYTPYGQIVCLGCEDDGYDVYDPHSAADLVGDLPPF